MLVLSRLRGETIIINDTIKITVLEIKGGKVHLGVECDQSIPVHRGEVWAKIKEVHKPE